MDIYIYCIMIQSIRPLRSPAPQLCGQPGHASRPAGPVPGRFRPPHPEAAASDDPWFCWGNHRKTMGKPWEKHRKMVL